MYQYVTNNGNDWVGFGGTDNASALHCEPIDTAFSDAVAAVKVSGPQLMLQ
jgi:hypothetical protein